jgi:hypothetical protein
MASAALVQAARIKAPFDVGSNDFGVRRYTITTTARADAVPASWAGRYVRIFFTSATATDVAHFGFSRNPSAVIDGTAGATDAGTATSVGMTLKVNESMHVRLPGKQESESIYFCRDLFGAGAASMDIALAG